MSLKTHDINTIVDISYPTKLAVDWITNNIYFIDKFYPNGIRVRFCAIQTTQIDYSFNLLITDMQLGENEMRGSDAKERQYASDISLSRSDK